MDYVLVSVLTMIAMYFLLNIEEIACSYRNNKNQKNLNRLFNGVPSHCVAITEWDCIFDYRNHPFYINGVLYRLNKCITHSQGWWMIHDKTGNHAFLSTHWESTKGLDGKSNHERFLYLGKTLDTYQKVNVSAVLRCY